MSERHQSYHLMACKKLTIQPDVALGLSHKPLSSSSVMTHK